MHQRRSQARLHYLFKGFADMVCVHVKKACSEVLRNTSRSDESVPLRILDLGAGTVPYARAIEEVAQELSSSNSPRGIEVLFLDKDLGLTPKQLAGCKCDWKCVDVLSIAADEDRTLADYVDARGPFDVVIMSASLHEFYCDALSTQRAFWNAATFHKQFLGAIARISGIRGMANSRMIIADYAWSELAEPSHLAEIAVAQCAFADHADPPWSFVSPKSILESMFDCGFRLQATEGRGLFDQLDDQRVKQMLHGLSDKARDTLRLRVGYVFAVRPDKVQPIYIQKETNTQKPARLIESIILDVSYEADKLFKNNRELDPPSLRAALNGILTKRRLPEDKSCLVSIARQIYRDCQQALRAYKAADPGICEIWFGIGMREFKNSRFIPMLDTWWNDERDIAEAGVLIGPGNEGSDKEKTGVAGPISIVYNSILGMESGIWRGAEIPSAPSIHNWCVNLHRQMRAAVDQRKTLSTPLFRSITILSSTAQPHHRAISAAWGDDEQQRRTGHYILILPNFPTTDSFSGEVHDRLAEIARVVVGMEVSWLAPDAKGKRSPLETEFWLYSVFLTFIFGLGDFEHIKTKLVPSLNKLRTEPYAIQNDIVVKGFDSLVSGLQNYVKATPRSRPVPHYTAYTTLALGCDGVSEADPDTLMLFSDLPIPPAALDRIERYASELSRPLVEAENEALIRRESELHAELQTTARLIPAFGHDAKFPASLIASILGGDLLADDLKTRVSKALALSLSERLAGYTSIIAPKMSPDVQRLELWREPRGGQRLDKKDIAEIWKEVLSSTLLAICVVDKPEWSSLKTLLGVTSKEKINQVASCYPSLEQMLPFFQNLQLELPHSELFTLEGFGGQFGQYHTYPVYHAVRVILAEILNNAIRHEMFSSVVGAIREKSPLRVCFALSCEDEQDQPNISLCAAMAVSATLRITIRPSGANSQDAIERMHGGLASLRALSTSIGCEIDEKPVGKDHALLPFFKRLDDGIEWTIRNVPLFRENPHGN